MSPTIISSRTPEGDWTECPICRHTNAIEPSTFPVADACCPNCGSYLRMVTGAASSKDIALRRYIAQFSDSECPRPEISESVSVRPRFARLGVHEVTQPRELIGLELAFTG